MARCPYTLFVVKGGAQGREGQARVTQCADRSIPQQLRWFREGLEGVEPVLAVNFV